MANNEERLMIDADEAAPEEKEEAEMEAEEEEAEKEGEEEEAEEKKKLLLDDEEDFDDIGVDNEEKVTTAKADADSGQDEDDEDEALRIKDGRKDRTTATKQRMTQLLDGSSVSGLSHATGAPSCVARFIWSILLIAGFIGLVTNLTQLLIRYTDKPVLTVYIAESEHFRWPDITFCNHMNPIHFHKHPALLGEWQRMIQRTKAFSRKVRYAGKRFANMEHVLAMSSIDPMRYHMGDPSATVFLWSARTKNTKISTSAGYFERFERMKLNLSDFYSRSAPTPFPTPCFTFNPSKNAYLTEMARRNQSLQTVKFTLIMNFDSYMKFNSSYENRGLYMFMKAPDSTLEGSSMVQLSPGSTTTLHVSMGVMVRLPDRAMCEPTRFTTELYDALLTSTRTYYGGYDDCRHYVSQKMFLRFCGCYNPMLPIHRSHQQPPRLCFNMTIYSPREIRANFDCVNKATYYYTAGAYFDRELERECTKFKLPSCIDYSYKKSQSSRKWPKDINRKRMVLMSRFAKHMGANISTAAEGVTYVRRNFAVVEINKKYSRAKVLKEEYEYSTSQLISDIGGTLGLWLGLSFVGVFELVEILLVVIQYLISEARIEGNAYKAKRRRSSVQVHCSKA